MIRFAKRRSGSSLEARASVRVELGLISPGAGKGDSSDPVFVLKSLVLQGQEAHDISAWVKSAEPGVLRLLVIPGEQVLTRRLMVSGETPPQREAAARHGLRQTLASQSRDVLVRVSPDRGAGDLATACALAPEILQAALGVASQHGFQPDRVVPDHLFLKPPATLQAGLAPEVSVAQGLDGRVMLAFADQSCTIEADLAEIMCDGHKIVRLDSEDIWSSGGIGTALATGLDLRETLAAPHARAGATGRWQRVVATLAASALLVCLWPWVQGFSAQTEARSTQQKSAVLAQSALGPGRRITNPRAQLAGQLADVTMSADQVIRAHALLAALVAGTANARDSEPASGSGVEVRRLDLTSDGMVRLLVSTPDKATLDAAAGHLMALQWPFELTEGPTIGGRVSIELSLAPGPAPMRRGGQVR